MRLAGYKVWLSCPQSNIGFWFVKSNQYLTWHAPTPALEYIIINYVYENRGEKSRARKDLSKIETRSHARETRLASRSHPYWQTDHPEGKNNKVDNEVGTFTNT